MSVTVRFFASLREAVGRETIEIAIDEPRLDALRAGLAAVLDADAHRAVAGQGVKVCVNQMIVRGDARLHPGDEVAFLPPVTGG